MAGASQASDVSGRSFSQSSLICISALRMKMVTAMAVAVTDLSFELGICFLSLWQDDPWNPESLEVEMISMLVSQRHVVQARL